MSEDSGKLKKDIVVLRHPGKLSEEKATNLKLAINQLFVGWGYDVHILLLEEGIDIKVLPSDNQRVDMGK